MNEERNPDQRTEERIRQLEMRIQYLEQQMAASQQPMRNAAQSASQQPMRTGTQPTSQQPMRTGAQPFSQQPMRTGAQPFSQQPMQSTRAVPPYPASCGMSPRVNPAKMNPGADQINQPGVRPPVQYRANSTNQSSMESRIGKQVMGILASLLIFIGLISLAVLVYPYLGRFVKFVFMWGLGLGLFLAGGGLYWKKKNPFTLSLFACGVGAVYLSILLTRLYFRYINNYVLYGLFFVWVLLVLYMTKKLHAVIFSVIAYLGLAVSVIFGATAVYTGGDLLFLALFQSACLGVSLWMLRPKFRKQELFPLGMLAVVLSLIQCLITVLNSSHTDLLVGSGFWWARDGILLAVLLLFLFFGERIIKDETIRTIYLCCMYGGIICYVSVGGMHMGNLFKSTHAVGTLCGLAAAIVLGGILIILERSRTLGLSITVLVFISVYYIVFQELESLKLTDMIGMLPLYGAWLLIGLLSRKNGKISRLYLRAGMIVLFLTSGFPAMVGAFHGEVILYGVVALSYLVVCLLLVTGFQGTEQMVWKNLTLYLFLAVLLPFVGDCIKTNSWQFTGVTTSQIQLLLVAGVLLLAGLLGYSSPWRRLKDVILPQREKERVTVGILLGAMEIWVLWYCLTGWKNSLISFHLILVFMAILVCVLLPILYRGCFRWVDGLNYLLGIQYTGVILISVYTFISYEKYAVLSSVLCLVAAMVSILVGFWLRQQGLRFYGLGLSVASVLKLVLFDINYENSITRVIGFVVAGGLCFGISFVYNKVSKTMKQKEEQL